MSQKITYIHIKNFKGISNVEVNNPSRFVAVFWENWAWKTSFIEAIKNAIKAEKWVNSKIKLWEESGEIVVSFEDFKIKRIIWKNWWLTVEHNWELVSKPQARLDWIFLGTIGDPWKFLNLHNKDKVKYLLETQWKKLAFDELELKRSIKYDERAETHRTYLAKKEEVEKTDLSDLAVEEVESVDIIKCKEDLKKAEEHNTKRHELKSRKEKGERVIEDIKKEFKEKQEAIENIDKQIEMLKQKREKTENDMSLILDREEDAVELLNKITSEFDGIEKIDTEATLAKIQEYNENLAKNSDKKAKKDLYDSQVKRREELQEKRRSLDNEVLEIESQQNELVKDLPLEYKVKVEDWVMSILVGETWIPLDELNTALQLEIGVDICLNWPNKIKIITIENANALDPNTLERVRQKIEKHQAQCFLETVYSTGYNEIIIKDWENI